MELGNRQGLQELITFLKALRRFTTTAYHHVNPDESIRHLLLDQLNLMSKESLIITAMHQLENLIATALQRYVEMRHESPALGTIFDEIIITEVWLQTGNSVSLDALYSIKSLHQIQKALMSCLTEISDIHASNNDFLTSLTGSLLRLFYKRSNTWIAGIATGKRYCTIGTIIIATILYLQKITGAVATGTRRLEGLDFLGLHTMMLMKRFRKFLRPSITQILYQMSFLISTKHQVNTFYLAHIL